MFGEAFLVASPHGIKVIWTNAEGERGMISRRGFFGGAASVALAGLMALTGCEGGTGGLEGKTLYCAPAWSSGKIQSVTFTDGENCNYAGDQELSGTWSQDDEAIVIALPGYESMTLKRVEGEDAYVQSGWEDLGERYYPTEEEAVEYRDEFLSGSGERVGTLLESTEWCLEADGNVRKADEAISFKDGKAEFEKGEYDESARFNKVPDEGKWVARDHSGECAVEVESFTASRSGSSMVPLYTGTLTVGGESVPFTLQIYENGPSITLDGTIRFSDERAFQG